MRQHINKVHGKEASSFSDLIRVPVTDIHLSPATETGSTTQVQIQVQTPTLVPVTAITTTGDNNNATTITTIQLPAQVFQALPAAVNFSYTTL